MAKDSGKRYFKDEINVDEKKRFNKKGLVASANLGHHLNTSTFFITLTDEDLPSFVNKNTIFG